MNGLLQYSDEEQGHAPARLNPKANVLLFTLCFYLDELLMEKYLPSIMWHIKMELHRSTYHLLGNRDPRSNVKKPRSRRSDPVETRLYSSFSALLRNSSSSIGFRRQYAPTLISTCNFDLVNTVFISQSE